MAVEHQVSADKTARVGETIRMSAVRGIQEQAWRFRTICRQDYGTRFLRALVAVRVVVEHFICPAFGIGFNPEYRAFRPNLAIATRLGQGDHRCKCGGLGANLAAEERTESTIYASWSAIVRL